MQDREVSILLATQPCWQLPWVDLQPDHACQKFLVSEGSSSAQQRNLGLLQPVLWGCIYGACYGSGSALLASMQTRGCGNTESHGVCQNRAPSEILQKA